MEPTLSVDDAAFVDEFRRIVVDAASGDPIPPTTLADAIDRRFRSMDEVLAQGGWQQAAAAGASDEPAVLLTSMVEAAARPSPTVAYPLVEMWLAHRILAVADGAEGAAEGELLLGDASAAVGAGPDRVAWPFADRAHALIHLTPGHEDTYDVVRVAAKQARWEPASQPDVTRPAWHLVDPGVEVRTIGTVTVEQARGLAAEHLLLEAAEMLGCAQGLFDATREHVSTREQFGRVLATFQALSHRLADAHVGLETVRSLVAYGAWVADSRPGDALEFALMAKGLAGDTCWDVANEAIQFHGAMGFTWEMNLQHPATRIITRALAAPSSEWCFEEVSRIMRDRGSMVALVE